MPYTTHLPPYSRGKQNIPCVEETTEEGKKW
jgi:hypothetical protein